MSMMRIIKYVSACYNNKATFPHSIYFILADPCTWLSIIKTEADIFQTNVSAMTSNPWPGPSSDQFLLLTSSWEHPPTTARKQQHKEHVNKSSNAQYSCNFTCEVTKDTSQAAKGALVHRLQHRTACKIQNGHQVAPKWKCSLLKNHLHDQKHVKRE